VFQYSLTWKFLSFHQFYTEEAKGIVEISGLHPSGATWRIRKCLLSQKFKLDVVGFCNKECLVNDQSLSC